MFMALIIAMLTPAVASARDNDLVLSRYTSFDERECVSDNGPTGEICGIVEKDTEAFQNLVVDLGEVFGSRFANPAETLGEAGFAFGVMTSLSFIPNDEEYWQDVVEDQDPGPALFTAHVQVRKGLPFSFELVGNMSYLSNSEMFAMGADLKWALHEGFTYMPDVAVRGSVNTLLGAEALNLFTAGWDISVSKDFGVAGLMSIAPYAGYQNLYIIGSSRLINAFPQDPRPPQTGDTGGQANTFAPETVFEQYNTDINRFFLGTRLNVWVLSFVLEGVISDANVRQLTLSLGADF